MSCYYEGIHFKSLNFSSLLLGREIISPSFQKILEILIVFPILFTGFIYKDSQKVFCVKGSYILHTLFTASPKKNSRL